MTDVQKAVTDSIKSRFKSPFLAAYAAAAIGCYWKGLTVLLTAKEQGQERVDAAAVYFHFGWTEFLEIALYAVAITISLAVLSLGVSWVLSIIRGFERFVTMKIDHRGIISRRRLKAVLASNISLGEMAAEMDDIVKFSGRMDAKRVMQLKTIIATLVKERRGTDGQWLVPMLPAILSSEDHIHVDTDLFKGLAEALEKAPLTFSAVQELVQRIQSGFNRREDPK